MLSNRDILIEITKHISLNELHKIIILNKHTYSILTRNQIIWKYKYDILKNLLSSTQTMDNDYKMQCRIYLSISRLGKWKPLKDKYNIDQLIYIQQLDLYNNQITQIPTLLKWMDS